MSKLQAVTAEKRLGRLNLIADLKSLMKARVLIANVLPVFVGFWLALYIADFSFLDFVGVGVLVMSGSTLVIAGALVLNNWYDADIDAVMARTKERPTVTGRISLRVALIIGIVLSVLGFALLLLTTMEAIVYAFVGWVTYVFPYTIWSKRRYTFNTVIGSVSGAVTPLIGWTVISPGFHVVPLMLSLLLLIWQMPHTYAIAMRKYDEYRAAGVAMLPVVHGFAVTKKQIAIYVACLLPIPFFLWSLGLTFVVVATLLNVTWLVLCIRGLLTHDDRKYADVSFLYSVNYLMIIFILMVIVTI